MVAGLRLEQQLWWPSSLSKEGSSSFNGKAAWDVSVFEVALRAAVHAVDGTRVGAWVFGHRINELEQVHQGLRPVRARLSQERAQQYGQQVFGGQAEQSGSVGTTRVDAAGGDLEGGPSIGGEPDASVGDPDGRGVLGFLGDAVEWFRDLW